MAGGENEADVIRVEVRGVIKDVHELVPAFQAASRPHSWSLWGSHFPGHVLLAVPPHFGGREQHPQLGSEVLLASRAALLQPSSPQGRGAACHQALLLNLLQCKWVALWHSPGGQCWGAPVLALGLCEEPCQCCLVRRQRSLRALLGMPPSCTRSLL